MGESFEAEGKLTARREWLRVSGLVAFIVALLASFARLLTFESARGIAGAVNAASMAIGFLCLALWWSLPRTQAGRVTVGRTSIDVDGESVVPRAQVKQAHAFTDPRGGAHTVRVRARRTAWDFAFQTPRAAAEFLTSLGVSTSEVRAEFAVALGGRSAIYGLFAAGVVSALAGMGIFVAAAASGVLFEHGLAFLVLVLAMMAIPTLGIIAKFSRKLVVGNDGVTVKRAQLGALGFGVDEFIPYARLGAVASKGTELHLSIEGEAGPRRFGLATSTNKVAADIRPSPDVVAQRIEEARGRLAERDAGAASATLLARGEKSAAEWLRDLSRLTDDVASFRSSAIPRDELWRVVDDPSAAAEVRAGAAVALRARIAEPERARLRVAAGVSAAPALQRVFLALDRDGAVEDEALATALDGLVEPSRTRTSRET